MWAFIDIIFQIRDLLLQTKDFIVCFVCPGCCISCTNYMEIYWGSQHIKPDFKSSDLRCTVFKSSVLNNRFLWSQIRKYVFSSSNLERLGLQIFSLNNPSNYANIQSSGKYAGSPYIGIIYCDFAQCKNPGSFPLLPAQI